MLNSKPARRSSSATRSLSTSINKKQTVFPLPNATKPRYVVAKKLELHQLPDVVLLEIFRYLTPIDLLNISTVCRRWHSLSQDESLWRSLVYSYDLHQTQSELTSKQRVKNYLNKQIKSQLKTFFPTKFDILKSYTGIADYKKTFEKHPDQLNFLLTFCDDKHNVIWSQKYDTIKFFDTSMSLRWLDVSQPELLSRVHFLRLFSILSIDINTRPNRTRLPKNNEQLADVTQKPILHKQRIQSLLHEYSFEWNSLKTKSISLTNDSKSPIRLVRLSNEDDYLLGIYEQDKSFAFILFNINYLSFHELFFTGLNSTKPIPNQSLSNMFISNHYPKMNDIEVSVFICLRNMTTVFLRHRFLNCRLKFSSSPIIEFIRTTDMAQELGPEIEELPKFNWKTNLFKGTINDLFIIDIIILNERKNVSFCLTLPASITSDNKNDEFTNGADSILSSNIWNIQAASQCNSRIRVHGTIMRLDNEYCALGRDSKSWHLQNMTCTF